MAGEIVVGAVEAVAQAASTMAEMPVAAISSVGVASASIPQAIPAVSEAVTAVAQSSEIAQGLAASVGKSAPEVAMANAIETTASRSPHDAMRQLAFGEDMESASSIELASEKSLLQQDFMSAEKMGSPAAQGLLKDVDALRLPQEVLEDPQFAKDFMDEFGAQLAQQKKLMEEGKLSPEEYAQQRAGLLQQSAEKVVSNRQIKSPEEKDLERIKREAAMAAIRQQMQVWRQSIMLDKRLSADAKNHALKRVDLMEKRLLIEQSIKWDGLSIIKLIALATVWIQEAVNAS